MEQEVETTLAQSIRVTELKAQYDESCKQLLSEKSVLAWIMKSCLEEYRDCTIEEIERKYIASEPVVDQLALLPGETDAPSRVVSVGQEDSPLGEETIRYDIRFVATAPSSGEPIRLIVNVESQNKYRAGYPLLKRAIYYCSRMISSQYGTEFTNSQYGKIRKVCSIWLCGAPPKDHRNTITRYRMIEENMVGAVHEPAEHYDLLTVVMLCLGNAEDEDCDGILKLLNVLLSNTMRAAEKEQILRQDFDLAMTQKMEMEVQRMCNLSEGVWERGVEQGMERGVKQGMERGRSETWTDAIRGLMKNMKLSVEQAMTALEIPEADRPKYRELLGKQ